MATRGSLALDRTVRNAKPEDFFEEEEAAEEIPKSASKVRRGTYFIKELL